ncbi:MAG: SDR family NAD(P)-dependent oxidoreductase [Acidimicrobiia bacterium]
MTQSTQRRLEGRTAIVTGASRGLGKSIALALAAEGAAVAVAARTEQVWDERLPGTIGDTVGAITDAGGRAVAIRADLLEPGDTIRLVAQAREALGPITILVNNAAFTAAGRPPKPGMDAPVKKAPPKAAPSGNASSDGRVAWPDFVGTPVGAYRRHFDIAVFAAYELMQLVVPDMETVGVGSIVNITSGASRMPGEGPYPHSDGGMLPGYGGSKAALEHLTMCAAYDLTDRNIAVNALSPSKAIMTPGVAYYARDFDDYGSEEDFAEATVRLAAIDPLVVNGRILGHLDVIDGSFRTYSINS